MDMDPTHLFATMWRRRFVALVAFCASLSLFVGYALFATRLYQGDALVLVDRRRVADASLNHPVDGDEAKRGLLVSTLVKLAQSEDIVRSAIATVGAARIEPEIAAGAPATFLAEVRRRLTPREGPHGVGASEVEDKVYFAVRTRLNVEADGQSDLFKISYRNRDPIVAADFTNAVAQSFMTRYARLSSNPTAVEFLKDQEQGYSAAYAKTADELREFMQSTGTFSVNEQRSLLLVRRDKAMAELAQTRGDIERAKAELSSLRTQLASLRSRMSLPPEIFGAASETPAPRSAPMSNDPSLLHLKLYQDSTQLLVKGNAELAGLSSLERNRVATLQAIDDELQALGAREAKFMALQRRVAEAAANAESFAKRKADVQFSNAWRADQSLSMVQIAQAAYPSWSQIEPKPPLILMIGLIVSALAAASAALLRERAVRVRGLPQAYALHEAGFRAAAHERVLR